MTYAPIALFVYKRPEHTQQTLEALMQCPEFGQSQLYVFCDGAKKPEDQAAIAQTRDVVHKLVGQTAKIIEAPRNQGLANSIIAGVTRLVNDYGRVIVLEDDLLVSPQFLNYMNAALEAYQDQPQVMQVSGYMFPVPEFADRTEALFLPFTVSWGWATWKRAWQQFDPDATGWEVLKTDKALRSRFNLDDSYDYFSMLQRQIAGSIDSWAIRWYWSVFRQPGLTLFPPVSAVNNIGFDGSGSHGWRTGNWFFKSNPKQQLIAPVKMPKPIHVDTVSYNAVKKSLNQSNAFGLGLLRKIKSKWVLP
jgi:hypothetical protein